MNPQYPGYYPQQQQPYYPPPPPQPYGPPPPQPYGPPQPQQQYYPQPQQPYYSQPQAPTPIYNQPQAPGYQSPYSYYVFNPNAFTETNNPWSANIWLQNNYFPQQPIAGQTPTEFSKFQSIEQFQELRHHATVESALKQLNELATDLSTVEPSMFSPEPACCFICCNSYNRPAYQLGVGPINDAITVAANHKFMNYKVYFLHNPRSSQFLNFLKVFLQKVDRYLTIYYTGHGAQVKDNSGDEGDGYDEVVVFDDGHIVDDKLAEYLKKYCNGYAHTILLNDCCHSGTIWDIPETLQEAQYFPPNILSISASTDNQTAKQSRIKQNSQGIFTFNFFTVIRNNPGILIQDVQRLLDPELRKFNQQVDMFPTREDMLYKPVFPLMGSN